MPTSLDRPPTSRRRRRAAVATAVVGLGLLASPLVSAPAVGAASTPQAEAANAWLAGMVAADGSVAGSIPGVPSVGDSVRTAFSLSMTGTEPEALARALGYVEANYESYVDEGAGDLAGKLANLILLAHAQGLDPTAFGTPSTDLVARLEALYGATEPGFYGTPDIYSAATDQSLTILALLAVGRPIPPAAVTWLTDQQCTPGAGPVEVDGAWQGYRAPQGGGLEDCAALDSPLYNSADSNTTAVVLQALAALGSSTGRPEALTFLRSLQQASGSAAGGFAYGPGGSADANSTAVVIQTIVAIGQDPSGAAWQVGGGTPMSALQSFILPSGADAGALFATWDPSVGNFIATYQGVWGLTQTTFPFLAVAPTPAPPTTPTTSPTTPTTTSTGGTAATGVIVAPSFTG